MLRPLFARIGAGTVTLALTAPLAGAATVEPVRPKQSTPVASVVAGPSTPTPTTSPTSGPRAPATTAKAGPAAPRTTVTAVPAPPVGAASSAAVAAPTSTVPGAANASPLTAPPVNGPALFAAARARFTNVYRAANTKSRLRTFDSRRNFSRRTVFRVLAQTGNFYKVHVPMRPNNTVGYVRAVDVSVYQHDWSIRVELAAHRLTVFKGNRVFMQEKVAIGQKKYPTPTGFYYLQELARPANPRGAYGPYAFGLAAWSNVLTRFGRGDGQIGLHGTNQPQLLGKDVSHGCIRLSNAAITKLAKTLPQGVPIEIRA